MSTGTSPGADGLISHDVGDLDVGLDEVDDTVYIVIAEEEEYILSGGGREELGQQLAEQESEREHGA